jgi:hypothetical protein
VLDSSEADFTEREAAEAITLPARTVTVFSEKSA